jgi:hypothetical protein
MKVTWTPLRAINIFFSFSSFKDERLNFLKNH